MLKIALDAMGGDKAPGEIVRGAVMAVERSNGRFSVVLTGPEATVRRELEQCGYSGQLIEIVDAPQLVAMDESPANVVKHMPKSRLSNASPPKKRAQSRRVSAREIPER